MTRAEEDRIENARQSYADESDGSAQAWLNANEYRDDGLALGERAFAADDSEFLIESVVKTYEPSARYLIAVAAYARCAELTREAATREGVAA
jgi:hypothetical protein